MTSVSKLASLTSVTSVIGFMLLLSPVNCNYSCYKLSQKKRLSSGSFGRALPCCLCGPHKSCQVCFRQVLFQGCLRGGEYLIQCPPNAIPNRAGYVGPRGRNGKRL